MANTAFKVDNGLIVVEDTTLYGRANISGTTNIASTLEVSGNTILYGNVAVSRNVAITGSTQLNSNLTVLGNTALVGNASVTGNTVFSGAVNLSSTLQVSGNVSLTSNVAINRNLSVTGVSTFSGNVSAANLSVSANISTGNLSVVGALVVQNQNIGTGVANAANTVAVSRSAEGAAPDTSFNSKKLNFVDSPSAIFGIALNGDSTIANVSVEVIAGASGPQGRQGSQGVQGQLGYSGLTYGYSSSIGNPSSGQLTFDTTSSVGSITQAKFHINDASLNDLKTFLLTVGNSTNTTSVKGQIVIREYGSNKHIILTITGAAIDNTTFVTVPVGSGVGSGGFFTNGSRCAIDFYRTGDIGVQGVQGNQGVQGAQGRQGSQGFQGQQGLLGAQGRQGNQGSSGGNIWAYNNTADTATDPGSGIFRFNTNLNTTSVTQIAIDDLDSLGTTYRDYVLKWADSTSTIKGYLEIQPFGETGIVYQINSVTSQTGFVQINVTHISGTNLPTNGNSCKLFFTRVGDIGRQGNQGFQGFQGQQGIQGIQGQQGIQGVQGRQGNQGFQGQQGIQGNQGVQGFQGQQGIQGNQGIQGVQGRQGHQGFQGQQGIQGVQGRQGNQGVQGVSGVGGENTNIIFNDNGVANGNVAFTFIKSSNTVTVGGLVRINTNSAEDSLRINQTGSGNGVFVIGDAYFSANVSVAGDVKSEDIIILDATVKTSNFNAEINKRYLINTTGGVFTMTLPASPSAGDQVHVLDYGQYFSVNSLTINRNGNNIMGLAEDLICDIQYTSFGLVYSDITKGWVLV